MRRLVAIGIVGAFLMLGTLLSAEAEAGRHGKRCCAPQSCCPEPACCTPEPCCPEKTCCTPRFRKARHHRRSCCTTTCCEPIGDSCGTIENGAPMEVDVEVDLEEAPVPTI